MAIDRNANVGRRALLVAVYAERSLRVSPTLLALNVPALCLCVCEQTAEACLLAFPDHDWMALVGLMHGLGKLLAHAQ